MKLDTYDIAIIGGGINGAGIAADAATRGLNVYLCEQNDLASATSSASSKLIHGGLRYLEQYEFRLVSEALNERESLLHRAKHLVKPLPFILPHQPQRRSRLLIRLGLFLYEHLARHSSLPKSQAIYLPHHQAGGPLKSEFTQAFQYWDCYVDDARLVIANAQHAKNQGATIATYTKCLSAKPTKNGWTVTVYDEHEAQTKTILAKVLINATGPWAQQSVESILGLESKYRLKLVKGSHIVVPKFYEGNHAYILQHSDTRVIFVIPHQQQFCLIGTTDVLHQGNPKDVAISQDEITYLLQVIQHYFKCAITPDQIIHSYAGVRPLLDNHAQSPQKLTRDYAIELNTYAPNSPLISIFGGKITTYRRLAEKVVNLLQPYFPNLQNYQETHMILPGSNYNNDDELIMRITHKYPWLPEKLRQRYINQYGCRTQQLLDNCTHLTDLGIDFGAQLYQKEVDYLFKQEWAYRSDDILWRRTKLGYFFPANCIYLLDEYLKKATISG